MISAEYVQLMARYNRWQNGSLYEAASSLSDAQRREDKGAFFGSIHGTLSHLIWADQMWMNRFAETGPPKASSVAASKDAFGSWDELSKERQVFDGVIVDWAAALEDKWLEGDLTWYSGLSGRELTKPKGMLIVHMFNHQTHHRGQVHCLLTQFGAKPEDTDIPFVAF